MSEGIISGAKVTITNDATGVSLSTETNNEGYFEYPSLPIGSYTLQAEQAGFKMTRQTNINIAVATRFTVTLTLSVGLTTQTVEVSARPPMLNTETTETGTVFQPKFMQDAPLFVTGGFRNPENFINYVPGVNGGQQETSINGGPRRSKEILIDGASHT
ncbi:MAG: carboxypeptidase-like regulatory domain-containing protein, partial [Acidobacteriota bacterium]|nr:carboxypeptidase-like regulatory domain-containing protein [Acidobacteriota bacterium]